MTQSKHENCEISLLLLIIMIMTRLGKKTENIESNQNVVQNAIPSLERNPAICT